MKKICLSAKNGTCDGDVSVHCTPHDEDRWCDGKFVCGVGDGSCQCVEFEKEKAMKKECETCAHEKDDSCSKFTCGGVYPSLWEPKKEEKKMEKKCETCAHDDNEVICIIGHYPCVHHSNWKPKPKPEKTYKQLKPISLEKLWEAQPDHDCSEFLSEWAVFMNWFVLASHLYFPSQIGWSSEWIKFHDTFSNDMKTHDHGPTWLGFMERHGFIEEVREFVPYDIAIRINSVEEEEGLKLGVKKEAVSLEFQVYEQCSRRGRPELAS